MITHPMSSDYGMNDKLSEVMSDISNDMTENAADDNKVAVSHISSDRKDTVNLLPAKWDVFTHKSTCTGGP